MPHAKRNHKNSLSLNTILNNLSSYVSLRNIEFFHIKNRINVLPEILSRAIRDTLANLILTDNPITKSWSQSLPQFEKDKTVTSDVIFTFLVKPFETNRENKTMKH